MRKIFCVVVVLIASFMGPPTEGARAEPADKPAQGFDAEGKASLASFLTLLNVPARGVACGMSGLLGSVVMMASGGTRYTLAADIIEEGCSGPWTITPQMIQEGRPAQTDVDNAVSLGEQPPAETETFEHTTTTVLESDPLSSLEAVRRGEVPSTPPSSPLREIYFDFDRYDLRADARQILDAHAGWLKENSSVQVEIEGHCDDRGNNEYNMALGAKRAQTARDYLIGLGIAAERLSTISYGEELPVCREKTEECWQKNRRARFIAIPARPAS